MFKNFLKPNIAAPPLVKYVVDFKDPLKGLPSLLTRSDQDLGGFSTVNLDLHTTNPKFARFHGNISLDIPEDKGDIVRLGYAMFRTKDLPQSFLGLTPQFHDWSEFTQLSLKVRGDYRKYFINIQSDTPYPTDLYQHRLYLKTPGEWETVTVNLSNFILTNGGIIQHQQRLETDLVKSVGIGLIDGQDGPYQLDVEWIKVQNGAEEEKPEISYEDTPMGKISSNE